MSRAVQQNVLQVGADGQVSANFPGGVQMPAATVASPASTGRSIRWVRDDTGGLIGYVTAFEQHPPDSAFPINYTEVRALRQAGQPAGIQIANLTAGGLLGTGGVPVANLSAQAGEFGGNAASVSVNASDAAGNSQNKQIIDAQGFSHFMQIGGLNNPLDRLKIIGPYLVDSTALPVGASSSAVVNHNQALGLQSHLVGNTDLGFGFFINTTVNGVSTNGFQINFYNFGTTTARMQANVYILDYT